MADRALQKVRQFCSDELDSVIVFGLRQKMSIIRLKLDEVERKLDEGRPM